MNKLERQLQRIASKDEAIAIIRESSEDTLIVLLVNDRVSDDDNLVVFTVGAAKMSELAGVLAFGQAVIAKTFTDDD